MENTTEILKLSKIKLSIKDNNYDDILKILINEIGFRILHITNQRYIPKCLYFTWASMVKDLYILEFPNDDISLNLKSTGISDITIGDTKIGSTNTHILNNPNEKSNIDYVINNYKADLIRHRKMSW